jgi:multidrug resistance efflux pump
VVEGGAFRYILKNPNSEEILEFGEEEHFLCQQFDGKTALSFIQTAFEQLFGVTLPLQQLEAFVRHLETLGLLVSETERSDVSWYPADQVKWRRLYDPDRLLNVLAAIFSWCFSPFFLVGSCLVLVLALGIAVKYASDFIYEMKMVWSRGLFLMVPVFGIFVINVLGEIAKGVACKHYGGRVHQFGVSFLYKIIPRFYCDIGDTLWVKRKSDRMRILFTGIVCQLSLWGVSIIAWKNTTPWTEVHTFWLLLTLASFFYSLLNLIPLVQRDGYYLLSTWLEIPNLRNRAITLTRSWILGRPLPEPLTSREITGFRWYGVLAVGLKVIFWSLLLGLAGYYLTLWMKGIGALLFLVLLYLRFEDALKRQCRRILPLSWILVNQSGAPKTIRRLIQVALLTAIVLIMFVPYPFTVGGDFRLLPVHQLGIRAQVSGEIKSVLVEEGQWVKEGQPVALLLGRDEEKKVEEIKAALDEAHARLNLLKKGPKPEEIAKAKQEVKTAAKSLEYSQLQADRYTKMFKEKAVSEQDYQNALRKRDLDRERLELAKRNLDLVKSGARDEEIEALEAEVRRLEVDLAHAEEDLRLTTLVSPADGMIITPHLSQTVGQFLGVGDLFAVIEDAKTIIAEIEVPEEDAGEVRIGSRVKLKTWAYPNTSFMGNVVAVAPVAYEKSKRRVERTLSEREWRFEQEEILREKGKVVRVLSELHNTEDLLKTDMTGYAKIECEWKPVGIAFTRWLVRFFLIEVWSWIPGFLW